MDNARRGLAGYVATGCALAPTDGARIAANPNQHALALVARETTMAETGLQRQPQLEKCDLGYYRHLSTLFGMPKEAVLLRPEAVTVIGLAAAERSHLAIAREKTGTEEQIPNDDIVAVIAERLRGHE